MEHNLNDRLFIFAIGCLKFIRTMPNFNEYKIIKYQLGKSATSSSANYEESQAGSSGKDIKNKVRISLTEMREASYWLRIV